MSFVPLGQHQTMKTGETGTQPEGLRALLLPSLWHPPHCPLGEAGQGDRKPQAIQCLDTYRAPCSSLISEALELTTLPTGRGEGFPSSRETSLASPHPSPGCLQEVSFQLLSQPITSWVQAGANRRSPWVQPPGDQWGWPDTEQLETGRAPWPPLLLGMDP